MGEQGSGKQHTRTCLLLQRRHHFLFLLLLVGAAAQAQRQVQRASLVNAAQLHRGTVVQLLACEHQALLVRRDALLVLDLGFDDVDGVAALHLQRIGLSGQRHHEDLKHRSRATIAGLASNLALAGPLVHRCVAGEGGQTARCQEQRRAIQVLKSAPTVRELVANEPHKRGFPAAWSVAGAGRRQGPALAAVSQGGAGELAPGAAERRCPLGGSRWSTSRTHRTPMASVGRERDARTCRPRGYRCSTPATPLPPAQAQQAAPTRVRVPQSRQCDALARSRRGLCVTLRKRLLRRVCVVIRQ